MSSPSKEGSDPNVMPNSAIRKRNTPGSLSPAKRLQKRRMSMKKDRRRVSFAPDPELTMIHTFEKDDDNSAGHPSPMMFEKIVEDMPLQQTVPAPAASPEVADMDITRPVAGSFSAEVAADEPAWRGFAEGAIGEITAALPSLGALAEADELEDAVGKPLYAISAFGSDITASVPGLGDLLAEDEAAEPASNVPAAMPETSAEMDMATGNLLAMGGAGEATPASMQRVQLPAEDPATVSPAAHSDVHPTGLANKWGFVPGDDDTMDLDLKGHGRLFMGDRTYNRMYAENMTMTTVRGAMTPAELTTDSMALVHGADAQEEEEVAQAADAQLAQAGEVQEREQPGPFGALPNWTAPAFMPPYMADGSGPSADHPALHQSPDVTNSSMNTLSTRRVSVDARRQSITSRRFSMADGTSQVFAQPSPGGDSEGGVVMAEPVAAGGDDDDTGDLLADEDDGLNPVGAGFAVIEVGGTDDAGFAVAGPTKTPGAAAASVGRADSSRGPTTGGLLRTGGTTDLLRDTLHHVAPDGPDTFGTHGTTRLLRMDITASSAIGARLPSVGAAPSPIDENAAVGSPANIGAHKMSSSPPPSALTAGSMGRPVSIRASPMVGAPHSVQSARSGAAAGITPSNHRLARTPGSAMALVPAAVSAPGTGAGASGWGPPGSAIAARYPGSAVATGRLSQGFTPSNLPPITFQDFAKLTEVQFLDNLRRGASINYADLQPNAVPTNLAEAYTLLCITSPNVAELETAIHTLQSETARLRASAADLEVMLGQSNPAIFRHVQLASYEQLEALRANVAALKKMCRAKAMALLKDVRCQMEESKACKLARALEGVRTDLAYVQDHAAHMRGVAEAAEKFAAETRAQMAARAQARVVEAERRRKVAAAMAAMAEQRAANEERRRRLEAAMQRAAEVQAERQALKAEHEAAQATADEIRRALSKLAVATGAGGAGSDPRAVLAQLNTVAALERCLGVKVERTGRDASGAVSLVLLVGALFRLRMAWTPAGVRGTVEMVAEAEGKSGAVRRAQRNGESTAALRSLAAAVAGWSRDGGDAFFVDPSSAPAALQAAVARLQRSSDLAAELVGVRLGCPHLAEVSAAPHCGALRVLFTGLDAGIRFAVTLTPGPAYPLGALPHAAQIWYDGEGQVTLADIAHAVARAPAGPGRIRAVCAELSALVERAAPAGPGAYHTNFGNPLFGAVAPGGEGAHAMEIVSAA